MKYLKSLLLISTIFTISFLISCGGDDDDPSDCTSCTSYSDSPYGTVGSSTCYSTLADCQDAESGDCMLCD